MTYLEVSHVSKRYGEGAAEVSALDNVSVAASAVTSSR
jgi:hypothetical protein